MAIEQHLLRFSYHDRAGGHCNQLLSGLRISSLGCAQLLFPGEQLWVAATDRLLVREHQPWPGQPAVEPFAAGELLAVTVGEYDSCGTALKLGFSWHAGTPELADFLYLIDPSGAPLAANYGYGWQANEHSEVFPFVEIRSALALAVLDDIPLGPRLRASALSA
jgi:hypothetical protein